MNDKDQKSEIMKKDLWEVSSTGSKDKLDDDFSSRIVKKSQSQIVFRDFLFMIVIGFKEILKGLLPQKHI